MSKTVNISNQALYKYHLDITAMNGSVHGLFFHSKISEFYKNNSLRINSLLASLNALRKKYMQIDSEGNTLMGEDKIPLFIEGMTKEDYAKEHTDIMRAQTILVI